MQRLLVFSRKSEAKPRPLNLNHQIEQLQKMLTRTIPKMIEIELSLADGLSPVNADPTQMDQVLMNLAVNARDAMPDGGNLTIETANVHLDEGYARAHLGVKPGEYVLLSVSDTGHGMDKETLDHIFEPFYTTKEAGSDGKAYVGGNEHPGGYLANGGDFAPTPSPSGRREGPLKLASIQPGGPAWNARSHLGGRSTPRCQNGPFLS